MGCRAFVSRHARSQSRQVLPLASERHAGFDKRTLSDQSMKDYIADTAELL